MTVKAICGLGLGIAVSVGMIAVDALADNRGSDWRVTGCAGVVEEELTSLKLGILDVDKVRYIVQSSDSFESDAGESLEGWVSFKNCKGNLVVKLSQTCQIDTLYTTGDCEIEDISDY
ncbi:hypothetical protein NBZ79_15070 [Sneathiella marina]|uniref:DUF5666 domain-containing protein n=1 Tax=Sneathiella marina TaxID=2950108 RepID=A0ABY4VZX7_9PROT|nr:hypothetical protein [Sneathiella marina]USG60486.1 hypothetical protein NBZ79_15070 [Sneathiella marina]